MAHKHKILKMIGTKDFLVELIESEDGSYIVLSETKKIKDFSIPTRDLAIALSVFDALYNAFQTN